MITLILGKNHAKDTIIQYGNTMSCRKFKCVGRELIENNAVLPLYCHY